MANDWVWDLEVFPNVFTITFEPVDAPFSWCFEISDRRNDTKDIINFVYGINGRMIGFNNLGFDYPILHMLIRMGAASPKVLYDKAQVIIDSQNSDDRWTHMVYESDRIKPQIDLFKIHHFDNKARATGLKSLEFNMRSDDIQDLPFKVGSTLTSNQIDTLKQYNLHDVKQTKAFYQHTKEMIRFREELCTKYPGKDWLNFNDTKIGKDFFIMELEKSGIDCYDYSHSGRTPKQTPRPVIHLKDAILPWIEFDRVEFNRIVAWLKQQSITETKGVFKDLTTTIDGFEFVFGLGGIHGSIENTVVESDDETVIVDLDVSSYYPNLAITNHFYPQHLSERFCGIYKDLYEQRKRYPKASAENAMLKLALNGVYGDSNNKFSVFYDPLFTMKITINGQLLLCKLAEELLTIPGLMLIQLNTDGLTVSLPRNGLEALERVRKEWEIMTKLELEEAVYSKMFIRDCNNYIAVYENGKVKRKGAYEYVTGWHQNAGGLVVPKVAEKVLIEGAPIVETVRNWPDLMDFMLRTKVPRTGYLQWGKDAVQNVSRYYVAENGKPLTKWLPPLKGKTDWRSFAIESGWGVQVCNRIEDAVLPVDYNYYIQEVEKLVFRLC